LIRATRDVGFTRVIVHQGFVGCSSVNLQQESQYCDTQYPNGDKEVWATRVGGVGRWYELSGFHSEKS
jgi:hypothetical protein